MESEDEAKAAIAALDGYSLKGSHIHVEVGLIQPLTVLQVSYASRKVMEFKKKISRPVKSWKMTMVMEIHGKLMEFHQYVMEFFNRRIIILGV